MSQDPPKITVTRDDVSTAGGVIITFPHPTPYYFAVRLSDPQAHALAVEIARALKIGEPK